MTTQLLITRITEFEKVIEEMDRICCYVGSITESVNDHEVRFYPVGHSQYDKNLEVTRNSIRADIDTMEAALGEIFKWVKMFYSIEPETRKMMTKEECVGYFFAMFAHNPYNDKLTNKQRLATSKNVVNRCFHLSDIKNVKLD